MKKISKLFIILVSAMVVLAACNDDADQTEETDNTNNQPEQTENNEPSDNTENEDTTEPSDDTTEEPATDEEPAATNDNEASASDGGILSLGETGTMDDTLGTYEVTPTAVEFVESADGESPYNGIFVVVDITIKNTGDAELASEDIAKADLFNSDDIRMESLNYYSFAENFEGPIAPGEEMSGQLVFDHNQTDTYQLIFGYGLETVSNEVKWEFSKDEAK